MIGWSFPSNNNGEETGINNSGIVSFSGESLISLSREINQNSLDAKDRSIKPPVEVHFKLHKIDSKLFPGHEEFRQILTNCSSYWSHNKETKTFFKKASKILEESKIDVLKISDFHTTGLTGTNGEKGSDWQNLVKTVGASDKASGSGGSFGIGKHAPFGCSALRTIFYTTKNKNGDFAFQGVSRLVTHENCKNETTQGTGYYGYKEKNEAIKKLGDVKSIFQRDEVGTDLFVFGFEGESDWEKKIIQAILDNFLVAIHQGELIVEVGKTRVDQKTLPKIIEKNIVSSPGLSVEKYYQVLTSEDSRVFTEPDFEGRGLIELRLLQGKNFPKKVAMYRKTGMLICEKGSYRTPMKFAGILLIKGKEINDRLRALESSGHDKWEPDRGKNVGIDPASARKTLNKLYKWIRSCVKEMSREHVSEEYDFKGMQRWLPDDLEEEPGEPDVGAGQPTVPKEVELVTEEHEKPQKRGKTPAGIDPDTLRPGEPGPGPGPAPVPGSVPRPVPVPAPVPDPNAPNPLNLGPFQLTKKRAFCSDVSIGKHRVILESAKQGEAYIKLRIVGEVEESIAPTESASCEGVSLEIDNDGLIGPITFRGESQEILVTLRNQLRCALEVEAYEDR